METKQKKRKVVVSVLALVGLAVFALFAVGGSLQPSAPPGPTMKTLDEVEPRKPITQDDIPLTITESGSYYLTSDVNSAGTAITVNVNDVTIDLMGYQIVGPGPGSNYGIYINGRSNVEIRNGTVSNFGAPGSMGSPGYPAIYEANVNTGRQHRIIAVRVASNGGNGIYLYGSGHLVKDCTAAQNGAIGIYAGYGSTVTGNTAYKNQGHGICAGNGSTIMGNTSHKNQGSGLTAGSHSSLINNTACDNTIMGIYAYYGSTVIGNTASYNKDHGIYANAGCTLVANTTYQNTNYGIYLSDNSLVDQNTAYSNATNMNACASCTFGTNHAP